MHSVIQWVEIILIRRILNQATDLPDSVNVKSPLIYDENNIISIYFLSTLL